MTSSLEKVLYVTLLKISDFNSLTGHGVVATYLEKRIFIGNFRKDEEDYDTNNINNLMVITRAAKTATTIHEKLLQQQQKITELESEGKTVVTVFVEDILAGL
jgi:cation transport ATPase